jgi:hypothetical protein
MELLVEETIQQATTQQLDQGGHTAAAQLQIPPISCPVAEEPSLPPDSGKESRPGTSAGVPKVDRLL